MIEITFSDSACGSLKMAQNYGVGHIGGCISVIIRHADGSEPAKEEIECAQRKAEEKHRLELERAVPMGGNPADVYGFDLALSVGDISEDWPGSKRLKAREHLFSIYPDNVLEAATTMLQSAQENLKTIILDLAKKGETLRLWYSNQPDELCGMFWFMSQLSELDSFGEIYLVSLPELEADENGEIIRRAGWGDVCPGDWHKYVAAQRLVPPAFCRSCAEHWHTLQKENAPLRAVLNGQLVSASETLYDDFIGREIAAAEETFQEAMVIGRVLGKYMLRISDAWVALRIEEMIRAGELEAVTEADKDSPIYHRILKKVGKR